MTNKDYQNSSCTFADQTMDYLYGEIEENDKRSFEFHLQECSACADELAGFSLLRSSIAEWKIADFESLATPVITLPIASQPVIKSESLFDRIRAYLDFSPGLTAAAAFALLLVFSGIIWFAASNSSNSADTIARKETADTFQVSVPEPAGTPETASKSSLNSSDKTSDVSVTQKAEGNQGSNKSVKATTAPGKQVRPVKTLVPSNIKNNVTKAPSENVPSLVNDDGDDNSLRLSDIFDEVGMYKNEEENNNE